MTTQTTINVHAHDLNRELFDLVYNLDTLATAAANAIDFDAANEFRAAVDAVKLAQIKLAETDLVIDASRDEKDQSHTATIG